MRKQLGVLASLLFFSATALMGAGCGFRSDNCCYDSTPQYSAPLENCSEGYQPGREAGRTVASQITCDGVQVIAHQPNVCLLGDQYCMDIDVHAHRDVCNITLSTSLPEGVSFIKSDPEPTVDGAKLSWTLGHMKAGSCERLRVCLRCEREGCLEACFCVSATPVAFCTIVCAKPVLCCQCSGPEEARPGEDLQYCLTVGNKGSCTAYDVRLIDNLPEGLEHQSGLNTLTFKVGDLAPGASKSVRLCAKAVRRGKLTNSIIATACNADQAQCECSCVVCKYCCEITKEGPKEVRVGQNADYKIVVTNIGDRPLTDLFVTDCAPGGTTIVSADGANICNNRAVWKVEELKPGEQTTLGIALTTCSPGYYCNRVQVTNAQGSSCCAEASTRWKGTPGMHVCITDMEDPICLGENTSYVIHVTNTGSEPDSNVRVTVHFPKEIVPLSAVGTTAADISGQDVTFTPLNPLGPRQRAEWRIDARAKERGDARVKVEVMSDSITTPIVQEESTIVN